MTDRDVQGARLDGALMRDLRENAPIHAFAAKQLEGGAARPKIATVGEVLEQRITEHVIAIRDIRAAQGCLPPYVLEMAFDHLQGVLRAGDGPQPI